MAKSLLFIPDISGFTHFVKTTEVEHSQHVIAELLEVLISANTQNLQLAEIEGDALFFYIKDVVPSQEKLLAQVESMYTAFFSHLMRLEKHRICPCNACAMAPQLRLKIIAHCGDIKFLEVQGSKKPFGEAVIEAHRLLKNSVPSDNYALISERLANDIGMTENYNSRLFQFIKGEDTYDSKSVCYNYAEIEVTKLRLSTFQEGEIKVFKNPPNLIIEKEFQLPSNELIEWITNYKYRYLWASGADKIEWNENEVTRIGSQHICTVGAQQLNFTAITKEVDEGAIVYGEMTTSPPLVDELNQFFIVHSISENESKVTVELYWTAKSPVKKLLIALLAKKAFKKGILDSLANLKSLILDPSLTQLPKNSVGIS